MSGDIPSDQTGAGGAECVERAEIAGSIDDDRITGIDEAAREEIEALLRSGDDEDVFGLAAEPVRDRAPQPRVAFGRAVAADGQAVPAKDAIERAAERVHREAIECGRTRGN